MRKRHWLHPWVGKTPGGGNGNPLQYSSLGNPMGRGAWQAVVHGAAKSQAQLSASLTHTGIEWETRVLWNKLLGRCTNTKILEKKWEWYISRCFITKLFNILSHLSITRAYKVDFFLIPVFEWAIGISDSLSHLSNTNQWWKSFFFLTYVFRFQHPWSFSVLQWRLISALNRVIRKNSHLYRLEPLLSAVSLFSHQLR